MLEKIASSKNIFLVGIKGGGMTSLALMLQGLKKNVLGWDTSEKFYTDKILNTYKIKYFVDDNLTKLPDNIDLLIYSTAYKPDEHPLCLLAKQKKIPLLSYPEALAELINTKKTIGIAGTHGKTTTTAWLAFLLQTAGFDPSAIIGSNVPQFNGSTLVGKSDWLVVETDEYQNKLKFYYPKIIVLNNIDWDHPDFFPTPDEYQRVFADYINKIPADGFLVAGNDNKNVAQLITGFPGELVTFGFNPAADWQAKNIQLKNNLTSFSIYKQEKFWHQVSINLKGDFNILNALAALATAEKMGAAKEQLIMGLEKFLGTERRFEKKGEIKNCLIYDDFAHHPKEIQATLTMVKKYFPQKKIFVVFHPHTFTRTLKLKDDFIKSFTNVDKVLLLDIYGSAREQQGGISSYELTEAINQISHNALYVHDISGAVEYLADKLLDDCLIITMGAGDVWRVGENLLNLK